MPCTPMDSRTVRRPRVRSLFLLCCGVDHLEANRATPKSVNVMQPNDTPNILLFGGGVRRAGVEAVPLRHVAAV